MHRFLENEILNSLKNEKQEERYCKNYKIHQMIKDELLIWNDICGLIYESLYFAQGKDHQAYTRQCIHLKAGVHNVGRRFALRLNGKDKDH